MEALKGRVAVVTGASEGIGKAIVHRLAKGGLIVAALARRPEKLKELELEFESEGLVVRSYVCDVQDRHSVNNAFRLIENELGGITIMINNAGKSALVDLLNIDIGLTTTIFNTNVVGAMSCIQESMASMSAHSIINGHIININSIAGHRAPVREHAAVYSASKHALRHLTEELRKEIAKKRRKIRVTSISPGLTQTAMSGYLREQYLDLPFLTTEQIEDAVMYAITAPQTVNISEIIIDPVY